MKPFAVLPYEVTRRLTEREAEVCLTWLGGGTAREMGAAMGISHTTINKHLENIKRKLKVEKTRHLERILRPTSHRPDDWNGSRDVIADVRDRLMRLHLSKASCDCTQADELLPIIRSLDDLIAGEASESPPQMEIRGA